MRSDAGDLFVGRLAAMVVAAPRIGGFFMTTKLEMLDQAPGDDRGHELVSVPPKKRRGQS
jgi:hypothetical protein